MILPHTQRYQIFFAAEAINMNLGARRLAEIVEDHLLEDAKDSGKMYVFRNRAGDRLRCFYWHSGGIGGQEGFATWTKWLQKGQFKFPIPVPGRTVTITQGQLHLLMAGK